MSRLEIMSPTRARIVMEGLYKDLERRIESSPPGLCPVDMARAFLELCHAQTCGKCVPCRIGLGQLNQLIRDVLNGKATMDTLDLMEKTALSIMDSADCAIGYEAANMVYKGLIGYRDDYVEHIRNGRCTCTYNQPVPCVAICPAHVDIPGYVALVEEGRYADAIRLIRKDNPFPTTCGFICEHPCEARCRRNMVDDAVNIRGLKRFAADYAGFVDPPECAPSTGKKVAVLGGGPGGLSAAYYLQLMGHQTTVYEMLPKLGGMLRYGIPNYRLPKDRLDDDINAILKTGVEVKQGLKIGVDITIQELREQYDAVLITIGASTDKKLGLPGEDADGVLSAVQFLRSVGKDEIIDLTGKEVVVIGGGNVAIDVARTALRAGSDLVSMYCLESEAEMPAAKDEVDEAREEDIQLQCGWGPKEILTENGAVTGIVLKKCVSVFDENHRFAPVYDENDCITVECEHVLLSIGQTILWGDLLKDTKVELRPNQTAQADPVTYQTAEPDIFVGGDVFTGPKFAIDAIAAGKQGCVSIHRFVHKGHSLTLGRDLRQFVELDKSNLDIEEFDTAKRQIPGKKSGIAKETFRDLRSSLTEEQVKIEAGRCLGCGASVVDENKCIGCGLCTTKCEFDAIHLSRDLPEASRMRTAEDKLKGILPYAAKRAIKIKLKKKS